MLIALGEGREDGCLLSFLDGCLEVKCTGYPKSSLSIRVSGSAPTFEAMNGTERRRPKLWRARPGDLGHWLVNTCRPDSQDFDAGERFPRSTASHSKNMSMQIIFAGSYHVDDISFCPAADNCKKSTCPQLIHLRRLLEAIIVDGTRHAL